MAKKRGGEKAARASRLLELARDHHEALVAAGMPPAAPDRLESALRALEAGPRTSSAAQVLVRDVQREIGEVQAAIRKEFPGNASFQAVFKADAPLPEAPRDLLALGRLVAREAPDYAANLIKYAINAATVKHLSYLCDQLEKELGSADPAATAKEAEQQIRAAAENAFAGKPELDAFG